MTIEERNEIIEQCAAVVEQCKREGMYQINGAAVRIRAMKNDPMRCSGGVGGPISSACTSTGPGIIEITFIDADNCKVQ